jgi:restriction endonuclease Mrr
MTASTNLDRNLYDHLLALDFHAFLKAISELLQKMGYEEVALAGRTQWIGRNRNGGYDLSASCAVPGGRRRVIVQVKQYDRDHRVYRLPIDLLRGVALRTGASEAILITTSSFSHSVDTARYASAPLVPVRLINGDELIGLLHRHELGVQDTPTTAGAAGRTKVNSHYFAELAETDSRARLPGTSGAGVQLTVCFVPPLRQARNRATCSRARRSRRPAW